MQPIPAGHQQALGALAMNRAAASKGVSAPQGETVLSTTTKGILHGIKQVISSVRSSLSKVTVGKASSVQVDAPIESKTKALLTGLYDRGVLIKSDAASEEFVSRLDAVFAGSGHDAVFMKTTVASLLKGDLDMAILVQSFPTKLSLSPSLSSQLNDVVSRMGIHGESLGTQPAGTTVSKQALRGLSHTLASFFVMKEGTSLNQLSSIRFDAKTVLTLMSSVSKHYDLDTQTCNILFGHAMLLQSHLDGKTSTIDADLKQAGIPYSQDQILSFSQKGLSGASQITHLSQVVQKFSEKISQNHELKASLGSTLTTRMDLVADSFKTKVVMSVLGTGGTSAAQRDQLLPLLSKKVEFKKGLPQTSKPLTSIIRLSILDAVNALGDTDTSVSECKSGKLDASILSGLSKYGLKDMAVQVQLSKMVRQAAEQFKGLSSVKSWDADVTLSSSQLELLSKKESVETSHFLEGKSSIASQSVKEVQSWVQDIEMHGNVVIDLSKGIAIHGAKALALFQEVATGGFSVDVDFSSKLSNTLMIETQPHPTDASAKVYNVLITESQAKKLGVSVGMLAGILTSNTSVGRASSHGVQLQFNSKDALGLFFSGLMHKGVNMGTALADISQVRMVDGKKTTVSQGLAVSVNLLDKIPGAGFLEGIVDTDFATVGFSVTASRSNDWVSQQNALGTHLEKTVEKTLEIVGKHSHVVGVKTTSHFDYQKESLGKAGFVKTCSIDVTAGRSLTSEIVHKGASLALTSSAKKLFSETPALKVKWAEAMAHLEPGDQLQVVYDLGSAKCFEVTNLGDPHSPSYSPEKSKAILADQSLYKPVSIRILSADQTETSHSTTILDVVSLDSSTAISRLKVKAEILLH
ncbi:MAG: hypothetical protein EXS67_05755 [Candidatus Margulisbacteria bacterium]|nr:hypothetical protein [Candidatus Margulisiibacteriota bacterium]